MCNYLQALAHLHCITDCKVFLYWFQALKLIISESQLFKINIVNDCKEENKNIVFLLIVGSIEHSGHEIEKLYYMTIELWNCAFETKWNYNTIPKLQLTILSTVF